jgi:heptaprenyl diphosphate synthase
MTASSDRPASGVELRAAITEQLDEFERRLRLSIAEDFPMAADVVYRLVGSGGKRLRPTLLLATASGAACPDSVYRAAMGIELIHTASLLHDDLIDDSPTRRGVPAAHVRLGIKPAILIGDYYFAKGAHLLASIRSSEIDLIISQTLRDLSIGELTEVAGSGDFDISVDEYMNRVRLKTGSLMSAACECGAILAGHTGRRREAFRRYGELLGLVFQITDDVLDYISAGEERGKSGREDLRQGIPTLPVIYALADPSVGDALRCQLTQHLPRDRDDEEIVTLLRRSRGIELALRDVNRLAQEALTALHGIPDSEVVGLLTEVVTSTVERRA